MRIIYILITVFFFISCDSFLKEKVLYEKYDNAIYIEDWDEAIRILDIVIDRETSDANTYFLRAQARINQQSKDFSDIIKDLTFYLEKVDDRRALLIRAQSYFQNSQYKEAIQDIDTLIASQGEKSLLLRWKANSAYAAKNFQVAEEYYRVLLRKPATHIELREIYKRVVLCEYFNDNFEGASWDVAFMESRGYERDSVFERQVIKKELSFDETTTFNVPNLSLDEIENELSIYCPEIDMKWHSGFFHTQLESELFRENPIKDLTSLLSKRLDVKRLSLRDTGIKELPKEIHQFIHLEELDLSRNRFSNVESLITDLSRLPNLKMLILDYTNLRKFPQNIALLQNLEVLSVEASGIKELPESLGGLIHLKYLSVRHNSRLIDLPATIGNLKCMEIIDVSGSGISRLRNELADCTSLKSIVGNASRIKSLPEDIGKLQNLVY
ncbi:tetratricopeptide repeat protein, partial [Dokdonia sp.]